MRSAKRRVSVGVIGAGATSQLMHLPILSERSDVAVTAVSDLDDLKARAVAERFGVPRVLDDDALVGDDGIDGIVICAPSFLHEGLVAACLKAGKHVLVERPLALSSGGVRWLLRQAEDAGRGIVLGMSHRYQPDVSALRTVIADGGLGAVSTARVAWLNQAVRRPRTGWRRRALESGGGALMDLGVPALDLALWVLATRRSRGSRPSPRETDSMWRRRPTCTPSPTTGSVSRWRPAGVFTGPKTAIRCRFSAPRVPRGSLRSRSSRKRTGGP